MARRSSYRPTPRWHQRVAAAGTPVQQLAVAYDRLRAEAARACRRQRDPVAAADAEQFAASVVQYATELLHAAAERLEQYQPERVTERER